MRDDGRNTNHPLIFCTRCIMTHLARRKLFCFVCEVPEGRVRPREWWCPGIPESSFLSVSSMRRRPQSRISIPKFDTCPVQPAKYFGPLRIRWLADLLLTPLQVKKGVLSFPKALVSKVGRHAKVSSRQRFGQLRLVITNRPTPVNPR